MGHWFPCFWVCLHGRCLQLEFILFPTWKLRWNPKHGASRIGVLCDSDKKPFSIGKSSYVIQKNPLCSSIFHSIFCARKPEKSQWFSWHPPDFGVATSLLHFTTTRQLDLPSGRWREVVPHESVPRPGNAWETGETTMEIPWNFQQQLSSWLVVTGNVDEFYGLW